MEIDEAALGVDGVKLVDEYENTCSWKVRRKYDDMYRQLEHFLKQFTTTKQVYENWPEGRDFLPKESKTPGKALIVQPESVNKLLGLAA